MKTEAIHKHKYVINFYRIKKIKGKILVVTEEGGWAYISKKKYDELIKHEIDEETLKLFEKNGIIINEKNINRVIKIESSRRRFLFYPPSLHIIIPTLRCNHRCIYCHSSAKSDSKIKYDMDVATARKTVDFIMSCPSRSIKIEFQGGESLLNLEVLKEIVTYAEKTALEKNKKVRFVAVSNLTTICEPTLLWLKGHNVRLTTSLDGPKEVHDKNRIYLGGNGTYDDVMKKIKFCRKHGMNTGALMVTTRYSFPFAKEIVDTYLNLGFNCIQLKFINKIGFAEEEWRKIGYTADEYLKFWRESMEHIIKRNLEGKIIYERFTVLLLKKIFTFEEPGFLDFRNPCGIAFGQIAYDYNGDIYSCDEGRGFDVFNLGNVWRTTYEKYAGSKKTQKLLEASVLETNYCDTCVFKPYCGQCPVLNYAETRNIIPKIATSARCKIMKGMMNWVFEKILLDKDAREVFKRWLVISQK